MIRIDNLTAGYHKGRKEVPVLKALSFDIFHGEIIALAGSNGIGKSTLLKTIAGLIPKLEGNIILKDIPLERYDREKLSRLMSIVLTGRIPVGNIRTRELISLGRYPYTNWYGILKQDDKRKIDEAIDLTGCQSFQHQPVYELSDGQLQKAVIARALAQDCHIILLDEPTAHLDLINKIGVMKLLKDLSAKTGKTILYATHELDLAIQVSDRLLLLHDDHTLVTGAPEDLVLDGRIDEFIRNNDVIFDVHTGKFLPVMKDGRAIRLEGINEPARTWTAKALERGGYTVTPGSQSLSVTIEYSGDKYLWKINYLKDSVSVNSIRELLDKLKTISE